MKRGLKKCISECGIPDSTNGTFLLRSAVSIGLGKTRALTEVRISWIWSARPDSVEAAWKRPVSGLVTNPIFPLLLLTTGSDLTKVGQEASHKVRGQ